MASRQQDECPCGRDHWPSQQEEAGLLPHDGAEKNMCGTPLDSLLPNCYFETSYAATLAWEVLVTKGFNLSWKRNEPHHQVSPAEVLAEGESEFQPQPPYKL